MSPSFTPLRLGRCENGKCSLAAGRLDELHILVFEVLVLLVEVAEQEEEA